MAEEIDPILSKIVRDLGDLVAAREKTAVDDAVKLVEADLTRVYDQLKSELRAAAPKRGKDER